MEEQIAVIEGPSGAGKDSIIKGLMSKYPNQFEKIISVCTREMRDFESQGNPYFFVTDDEFDKMLQSGDVFEYTVRHGTKRGMSEKYIKQILSNNKIALKDCDMIGVKALKSKFRNVLTIFITVPKEEIGERMRNRGDSEKDVMRRLEDYDDCIGEAKHFDYIIENKILNETVDKVYDIIYNNFHGKK
jgi:guanylate kinase